MESLFQPQVLALKFMSAAHFKKQNLNLPIEVNVFDIPENYEKAKNVVALPFGRNRSIVAWACVNSYRVLSLWHELHLQQEIDWGGGRCVHAWAEIQGCLHRRVTVPISHRAAMMSSASPLLVLTKQCWPASIPNFNLMYTHTPILIQPLGLVPGFRGPSTNSPAWVDPKKVTSAASQEDYRWSWSQKWALRKA